MEFTRVPRPAYAGFGRTPSVNPFQSLVNSLKLTDTDAVRVFVQRAPDEADDKLKGRVVRRLERAGNEHPDGQFTVRRVFDFTEDGANVSVWLEPKIERQSKIDADAAKMLGE